MSWSLLLLLVATAVVVVAEQRYIDYSLAQLTANNKKLEQINVQRKKVEDFTKRLGYFYGYVIPEIQWLNTEFAKEIVVESEYKGPLLIATEVVAHIETLNGYLDWVLDTSAMDNIIS